MSIYSPMNNKFQANDHQFVFEIAKFENISHRKCSGVYMNILGCSPTRDMIFIEYKIVQVHLNASD